MSEKPSNPDRRKFLARDLPDLLALMTGVSACSGRMIGEPIDISGRLGQVDYEINLSPEVHLKEKERRECLLESERLALMEDFKKRVLGFDAVELAKIFFELIGAPDKYSEAIENIYGGGEGFDSKRGFNALSEMFSDCGSNSCSLGKKIMDQALEDPDTFKNLGGKMGKLGIANIIYSYEEIAKKIQESIQHKIVDFLGLDLNRIKNHVEKYKNHDMAIYYGPYTKWMELGGALISEPFELYLQLAHKRKADVFFSEKKDSFTDVLLNPRYQHLAVVSHGDWRSVSTAGVY